MLLLVLTSVLGYELKTAVGTSVFIMTFTALTGAVSHFYIGGKPNASDYDCLCDQHTGVRAAWSKMGEQRKRKNAESRNRNPAVRAGNGDAVLLKKSCPIQNRTGFFLTMKACKSGSHRSVHGKNFTRYIGSHVACQEEKCICDIFCLADSSKRDVADQRIDHFLLEVLQPYQFW